jgi:hypothetical protein
MLTGPPSWRSAYGAFRQSSIGSKAMTKAFLEITMKIAPENRPQAAGVYTKYRQPFLSGIAGAKSKDLLVRAEDVQVLHGFDLRANAESTLEARCSKRMW